MTSTGKSPADMSDRLVIHSKKGAVWSNMSSESYGSVPSSA